MSISVTITVIASSAGVAIADSIGRLAMLGTGTEVALILIALVVAVEGLGSWLEGRRAGRERNRRRPTRSARPSPAP